MVQFGRPTSDVSDGGWVTETGATTLSASIDETTASTTDYIQSASAPSNDTAEIALGSVTDPEVGTGHIIRYKIDKIGTATLDLTVKLMQGTTEIASWSHTNVSTTAADIEQTLTSEQADAITNYGDLRLRFTANTPDAGGWSSSDFRAIGQILTFTSATVFVQRPANVVAGEYLIAVMASAGNVTVNTVPSGWTLIEEVQDPVNSNWHRMYAKVAGSSEPTEWQFVTSASHGYTCVCLAYSNGTNGAKDTSSDATTSTTTDTIDAPSISTGGANRLLIVSYESSGTRSVTTAPSGMTARAISNATPSLFVYEQIVASAGATGTRTIVISATSTHLTAISAAFSR